jgi:hypothetical protein
VGTDAYLRHENSTDAADVLKRAITAYSAPCGLLSDNSLAFNQLRAGRVGALEIVLASQGTMPITGLPGRPATEAIPLSVLEAKASEYRQRRDHRHGHLETAGLTVFKTGQVVAEDNGTQSDDRVLVTMTTANRQIGYQGFFTPCPRRTEAPVSSHDHRRRVPPRRSGHR